jgi:hypothetical protein
MYKAGLSIMLMRTRNAHFGSWNNFDDLVDSKPGKWAWEPPEDYRMVSADCDQKRTGPCEIHQDSPTKNLPQ